MKLSTQARLLIGVVILSCVCVSCSNNGHWRDAWKKQTSETPPGYADRNASEDVPEPVSSEDKEFAMKAAEGGLAEVELGTLAQTRGSSQSVKDFAKHLVDEHTKLDNELKALAAKHGIELPTDAGTAHRQGVLALSRLSGARFDREFIKDFCEGHHDDIAAFRKEVAHGLNPALKEFASSSLATLQEHHAIADSMRANPGE